MAALEQSHFEDDDPLAPLPLVDIDRDASSAKGAPRLKEKIEAYWRARGFDVMVRLEYRGFIPAMRSARTDIRSDLVDGLPRRRLPSPEQKP